MAIYFTDGFDHYTEAQTILKWSGVNTGDTNCKAKMITGRGGSGQAYAGGDVDENTSGQYTKGLIATPSTTKTSGTVGFAIMLDSTLPAGALVTVFDGPGNSAQIYLWRAADGVLSVTRYNYWGNVLLATGGTIGVGQWYWVEFKWTIHGSTGALAVNVDGTEVMNATNQNTQASGNTLYSSVCFLASHPSQNYTNFNTGTYKWLALDDIYVSDTYDTFKGDSTIDTKYPTANGTTIQGTPSTGDNYACVDEAQGSMTDYVSFAAAGDLDTYVIQDVATSATIHAVQVVSMAKKSAAGVASAAAVIRQGGSNYTHGTPVGVGYDAAFQRFIYEKDPTTADWTPTTFNGNEFGVKKAV